MKVCIRLLAIWLLLACAFVARSQESMGPKIDQVNIQYIGPASVSEQFIRSHIQLKHGDTYVATGSQTESDIHALYATGQFYNIRVAVDQQTDGGVNVTYIVQP